MSLCVYIVVLLSGTRLAWVESRHLWIHYQHHLIVCYDIPSDATWVHYRKDICIQFCSYCTMTSLSFKLLVLCIKSNSDLETSTNFCCLSKFYSTDKNILYLILLYNLFKYWICSYLNFLSLNKFVIENL